MDFIVRVLGLVFIVMVFSRLLMEVANFVGKQFGIGDAFIKLCARVSDMIMK